LDFFGKEKAKLRREGNLIHDFDLLIGATAVHFDMIMVTNNEKHLSRITGIKIENWIKNEVK
jgi:tRNA(fMet)-specific endonuclease VapC